MARASRADRETRREGRAGDHRRIGARRLLGWAALTAGAASNAADLLLAPEDYEMGVGAGVTSTVAPAWEAWFWVVAAGCAALAGGVLVRWALQDRGTSRVTRPTA